MVGAIRKERLKASRPYERKVHFEPATSDIPVIATPARHATLALIPGAEFHKLQKRKGVSATRRRSGGLKAETFTGEETDNAFTYSTDPYPKTPVRKTRAPARHPLATDMSVEKVTVSLRLEDPPSSPFGKSMGKPDVSDFTDIPRLSFLDAAFPSSVEDIGSDMEDTRAKVIEKGQRCHCAELRLENETLRRRYDALLSAHRKLLEKLESMSAGSAFGASFVKAESQDEMLCDADGDQEQYQSSSISAALSGSFSHGVCTPVPALASAPSTPSTASSSPTGAEIGTPTETPAMPLRVIDEDYDEGYDHRALRFEVQPDMRHKFYLAQGISFEDPVDGLTVAMRSQWKITDDSAASKIVFPPLVLPPLPKFEM